MSTQVIDMVQYSAPERDERPDDQEVPYTISSIPVNRLGHVSGYQRGIHKPWLRHLTRAFDWRFFEPPVVSERDDGSIFVIDGQHRIAAAAENGYGKTLIPVVLYTGLEADDEAELFSVLNRDHRKISPSELLEAQLYFEDKTAEAIRDAVHDAGFLLAFEPLQGGRARITSTGALRQILTSYRPGMLDQVLGVIADAWGTSDTPGAGLLYGMAQFLYRYGEVASRDSLVSKLAGVTVTDLEAQGQQLANAHRSSRMEGIGRAILATFNTQRRRGRLAAWELRGAEIEEEGGEPAPKALTGLVAPRSLPPVAPETGAGAAAAAEEAPSLGPLFETDEEDDDDDRDLEG